MSGTYTPPSQAQAHFGVPVFPLAEGNDMQVRAPNGQSLTVEGNSQPFIGGWAYVIWAHGPAGGTRFQVTPAGSTEVVSKQLGDWPRFTVREAQWNGGRILSLEDPEQGTTNMVWVGPHNEVATFFNGVGVPFEAFMDILVKFDVQDTPEGLTMLPRAGSGLTLGNLLAVNTIDQVCAVQVKPAADAADAVPPTKGKRVRGGSMWRVDEKDEAGAVQTRSAFMVNDSTATTVVAARPDDVRFIDVVETISCRLS
ncbi:hypothetical protein [Nonomuraea gerenzanensis]|uniref:hypothetical protein n=1 Tax=Nonomuraea gerenzanensis TaxID=93944 RepID=UPI001CD9B5F4|nr:hypothetical protein [Nonomuraea gerenzanensis]UBU16256.1 hypothetical protein LCN96_14940 [Nonomuraea gerenzanensis]